MSIPFLIYGSSEWKPKERPAPDYTKPNAEQALQNALILCHTGQYEEISHPLVTVYLEWVLDKEPDHTAPGMGDHSKEFWDSDLKEALTCLAEHAQKEAKTNDAS